MIEFIHIARAAEEAAANQGTAGTLGINLKLFIAQLVNFAVVLVVLWKWVFTPVAKKLAERTEKIEKSLNDADRIAKEKDEFGKWKDTEMSRVRSQAQAIVTAAQNEAGKAKDQIIQQTKQEQSRIVDQAKNQIESEKQKAVQDAKSELANLVTMATEKILREKLDVNKDKSLIEKALESLR